MDKRQDFGAGENEAALISDINVTPFIDIMLVLLIIFMVTAPLMMGGVKINLPKTGGTPLTRPELPLVVSLDADSKVYVDKQLVTADDQHAYFQKLAQDSATGEVYVHGDGEVKYGRMMELMSELGLAGFARVTLVTNITNNAPKPPTPLAQDKTSISTQAVTSNIIQANASSVESGGNSNREQGTAGANTQQTAERK